MTESSQPDNSDDCVNIVTLLRSFDDGRVGTHYPGCWRAHQMCAMHLAASEIEWLREELNTTQELLARCYKVAVGHGPNFDVFDDWEEAISAYERETHRG